MYFGLFFLSISLIQFVYVVQYIFILRDLGYFDLCVHVILRLPAILSGILCQRGVKKRDSVTIL